MEGNWVRSGERYDEISHSLSVPADHASRLCTYDHGLKAPVRREKVTLSDFEYCPGRKSPINGSREGEISYLFFGGQVE